MSFIQKNCIDTQCKPKDGVRDYVSQYALQDGAAPKSFQGVNCEVSDCPPTDTVPVYLGAYNLQSTIAIQNSPFIGPVGGGFYVSVPPGTFTVNPPPSGGGTFTLFSGNVTCPGGTNLVSGCDTNYTYSYSSADNPTQIQAILDAATAQVATIKAQCCLGLPITANNPPPPTTFQNAPQSISCGGTFGAIKVSGMLPGYITVSGTTVTIAAGVFTSSISQEDADTQAQFALNEVFDSSIQCGWYNADQHINCPNGVIIDEPAGSIFSTVSQADADAQALALVEMEAITGCGGLMKAGFTWVFTEHYATGGSVESHSSNQNNASVDVHCSAPQSTLSQSNLNMVGTWTNPCGLGTPSVQGFAKVTYSCATNFGFGNDSQLNVTLQNGAGQQSVYVLDRTSGSFVDSSIFCAPGVYYQCFIAYGGTTNSGVVGLPYSVTCTVELYCRPTC